MPYATPLDSAVVAPPSLNPFRVFLRHRNFRLFLIGQTASLIGTWMQMMAEGWLALELTNSAFLVGLVATAASIPIVLFTMPAGALVDRSDKLRLVRLAQVCFLIQATLLWALVVTHRITFGEILSAYSAKPGSAFGPPIPVEYRRSNAFALVVDP